MQYEWINVFILEPFLSSLHFEVSSGLKRVIGRDLITDDEVAVFELVKNSFDAGATRVHLHFETNKIYIVDDGRGMSRGDIEQKWLFVAYSAKRDPSDATYRERIAERRHFAGSKGIGRFSSDRLGSILEMQSRPDTAASEVHHLHVDWDKFEADDKDYFGNVAVEYHTTPDFELPTEINKPNHGTVLLIRNPRIRWDRARLLHLKSSLAKLINPFGDAADGFSIELSAPNEQKRDAEVVAEAKIKQQEEPNAEIVNGIVGNFIFSTLKDKTTFIEVNFSDDQSQIITSLVDRGELVYRTSEPNPYDELRGSGYRCQLFYLNLSAKNTFARRMGVPSLRFGSVFIFRNGFRVFPIGEDGDDWFGIDARKQQGYARFLGTRDVIGRIDVEGDEEKFKEASSRNQGLVETAAARQLRECFWEHGLKRLERYIVPVSWADKGEKSADDLSRLLTDAGRARVATAVARLVDNPDIELLAYSRRLITTINERSKQFESSIAALQAIARKTRDPELAGNLALAEQRFEELKAAEAEALRIAEDERREKEQAQAQARAAALRADELEESYEEERKRNLFLASLSSQIPLTIINMHHQITIYAADLKQQVENCIAASRTSIFTPDDLISRLEQIAFLNQKVLSISRLATKANFRLESDMIEADLAEYIEQYIHEGAAPFLRGVIELGVTRSGEHSGQRFVPMEVSIVIDNLISNARKVKASRIDFVINRPDKNTLTIEVTDDGPGLPKSIDEPERIFELGFSRTSGSGLGLYHVRQVLGEMGGSISIIPSDNGMKFLIRISK